jgi:hypothetical protein
VGGTVVGRQQVGTEVGGRVAQHGVHVVGPVLRVVELDQQGRTCDPVVVADPGPVGPRPGEPGAGRVDGSGSGDQAIEVDLQEGRGGGRGGPLQRGEGDTAREHSGVDGHVVPGPDVVRRLVGDDGGRPLLGGQRVEQLETELLLTWSGATAVRPPSSTTAGLAPRKSGATVTTPSVTVACTETWWPSNRTPQMAVPGVPKVVTQ